ATFDISDAQDGSELVTFPGGITFDDIEVTEIMLGVGNDEFVIHDTSHGTEGAGERLVTAIHGGGNSLFQVRNELTLDGSLVTRADGGDWGDMYSIGDFVRIETVDSDYGVFEVTGIDGDELTLASAVGNVTAQGKVTLWDVDADQAIVGGDHIVVDPIIDPLLGELGPTGPLVIYGDTSQDGSRYDSVPSVDGLTGNAIVYDYAGNDVIDASAWSGISSVGDGDGGTIDFVGGIVIYGGAGNDTIYGTQTGDHLAGGSGNDLIYGEGGDDHIYGDSGFNVDLFNLEEPSVQALTVVDVNTSDSLTADDLVAGEDEIHGDGGEDIILGDHGVITQFETERIRTTANVIGISSTQPGNGADDMLYGGDERDFILGGTGDDTIEGNDGPDVIFGDHGTIVKQTSGELTEVVSHTEDVGGVEGDTINGNLGDDLIIGGADGDTIHGDEGADRIFGDSGQMLFTDAGVMTFMTSTATDIGGQDTITGDDAGDLIIGGVDDDVINGNAGNDLIIGDNGTIDFLDSGEVAEMFSTAPADGGNDTIYGNTGDDLIIAGTGSDVVEGNEDEDIIIGDSGTMQFRVGTDEDNEVDRVFTRITVFSNGDVKQGEDRISGNGASDILLGGMGRDAIAGDAFSGVTPDDTHDLIFGDNAEIDTTAPMSDRLTTDATMAAFIDPGLLPLDGAEIFSFTAIDIGDVSTDPATLGLALGDDDYIEGGGGDDIILGQQGRDTIYGGAGNDDIIGGHNVEGGFDEGDFIDAGSGRDVVAGDNAWIHRRYFMDDDANLRARYRELDGTAIYGETPGVDDGQVLVQSDHELDVALSASLVRDITLLDHSDAIEAGNPELFGDDAIAGGSEEDEIFGQLGNDTIQGDGDLAKQFDGLGASTLVTEPDHGFRTGDLNLDGDIVLVVDVDTYYAYSEVTAFRDAAGDLQVSASEEKASDADDYIEGGGGNDVIFGNLGQDDIIGGSSIHYGLFDDSDTVADPTLGSYLRPDGSDLIFGGAGNRIARNEYTELGRNVDVTAGGDVVIADADVHARDADAIAGDNANIYRLVDGTGAFLEFNYDAMDSTRGSERIVVRAVDLVDYTEGGADFDADSQATDIGAADEIHGESGDDFSYGMVGNDVMFGDAEDDDLIGGYGHDWISGGTGQDGVLGDDGRIYTSRNSSTYGESLYGVDALRPNSEDDPRRNDGDVLDEEISTPGDVQVATINVSDALKKSVNLSPFNVNPISMGYDDPLYDAENADDIIFGGLDSDFLHGGSGDDAISGAEALSLAYTQVDDGSGTITVERSDWYRPFNPGDALRFGADRAGEFALYDEFDPLRKIELNSDGTLNKTADGMEWFLNFDHQDDDATVRGDATYGNAYDDGTDVIFGDLGNDWLVAGVGKDTLYGGWGNDLLNADDNHQTNGELNDMPETHPYFEDRAFGGAGLDVLIADTGGDRLIDWVGEFNSYLVPFAPFGIGTVSRMVPPSLFEFLYDLSESQGADQTRANDAGTDPARNGEPEGELGLITQKDHGLWQDQTGGPRDPQPGNIPGGPRDVIRGADFNNGSAQSFFVDSGVWNVDAGRLEVAPESLGGDAVSVYYVEEYLPQYFEIEATINAGKPIAGYKSNAFLIFDYQSPTDFKYAGINISNDKLEMGYRDATGWHELEQSNSRLKPDRDYDVLLAINGVTATLVVDNKDVFTHVFDPRVDTDGFQYALNNGLVGIGAYNSMARIDNVKVQILPPEYTLDETEDFSDGVADNFTVQSDTWTVVDDPTIDDDEYYEATPVVDNMALSTVGLNVAFDAYLRLQSDVATESIGGIVFDRYDNDDFKFAVINEDADEVIIGHYSSAGFQVDASAAWTLDEGTSYVLDVSLKGRTVSVNVNGNAIVGFA
ncbi:MAG: calcium-binding protein, partial [Acidobacteriota bacterium]